MMSEYDNTSISNLSLSDNQLKGMKTLTFEGMNIKCSCMEDGIKRLMDLKELWENYDPYD